MKFQKLIFGLLLSSILFAACNKNDDINDIDNKLQHRWAVTDALLYAGAPINDTIIYFTGTAADYFDFRNNGKVYTYLNGEADTSDYRIITGNKLVIDNQDTATIRILTNSNLQLYSRDINNGLVQETTVNMKR